MFAIVVYDVGVKRVSKVMRVCKKYFIHVQKSVFEGMISDAKLKQFQQEVRKKIDIEQDHICIYEFDSLRYSRKELIGSTEIKSNIL